MTKLEKRNRWQKHIENWQHSSLSQKEFCKIHHLKTHQFWYWLRQFRPRKDSETVTAQKMAPAVASAFVPVQRAPIQSSPLSPSSLTPAVTLANGIHIHGVAHMPLSQLTELVRALS